MLQQPKSLNLCINMKTNVLDILDLLGGGVVGANEQVLLVLLLLISQLPGDDPSSEGISPHFFIMNPNRKVDDLAPHVILYSFSSPVVIRESSSGPEVGDIAFGEDVEPLVEGGDISLLHTQLLSNLLHTVLDGCSNIKTEKLIKIYKNNPKDFKYNNLENHNFIVLVWNMSITSFWF